MSGKPNWFPLFSTQFLGVLNDNFLKNCIIFISIYWLAESQQGMVIPVASALLVLPFVILSPLAGKMAQVYSKQKIYEYAKLAEIPIMFVAVAGFFAESLWVVMAALFLMGVQSAIYAPSKYGLIRDVGGTEGLSYGVGTMELLTFLGVLLGQVGAGFVSDMNSGFTAILSAILIIFAIGGYITSRMIKVEEEIPVEKPKDSVEPLTFLFKTSRWAKGIKGLNTTILGLGSFWLVAGMMQMNIYEHAPKIYKLSNTSTSLVMALIAIGIGLGCFLAGKLSKNRVELGMVPLGGFGLSIILTIFATTELTLNYFIVYLVFAAIFSGFYKVPLSAWIQERVEGRKLGLALAYNQLVAFVFILAAAGIFGYVVNKYDTYAVFAVLAAVSWLMTLIAMANIPAMMLRFISYILAHTYFKFEIHGSEHIPRKTGAVIVANHLSMMDPFFMVVAAPRMLRFVMARGLYEFWAFHWLMKRLNMIPISGQEKDRLEEFNKLCQKEVNENHVLCIFPEGQISRIGQLLEFKKGIEHIGKGVNAPIIPVHMEGITGVPLSFDIGSSKPIKPLLSNFRKKITIEIGEPMPPNSPSTMLRQKVQHLNANTFARRIREHHTIPYFMGKTAKEFGDKPFQFGATENSFSSFYENARQSAGYWKQSNKAHVGIDIGNHHALGMAMASCLFAARIPVIFPAEMDQSTKEDLIQSYEIDWILKSDSDLKELLNTRDPKDSKLKSSDIAGIFFEFQDGKWQELPMTHSNFLASVKGLMQLIKDPETSILYSGFPGSYTYGMLTSTWFPYFMGMRVWTGKNASDKPVNSDNINTIFSLAGTLREFDKPGYDFDWNGLDYVITGNDALDISLQKKMRDLDIFVSDSLGVPLGATTIAVNTPDYDLLDIGGNPLTQEGSKEGSKGRPLPGIGSRIMSPDGIELAPDEIGELQVTGASVCDHYKDEDGWLRTGVQASYDREGFIHIKSEKTANHEEE